MEIGDQQAACCFDNMPSSQIAPLLTSEQRYPIRGLGVDLPIAQPTMR